MTKHREIPVELFKQLFDYNPETGEITNKIRRGRAKQGASAVSIYAERGYGVVTHKKVRYFAHRVAWALHTGEDPGEMQVDHINRDTSDNRIVNLRLATQQQNNCNVSKGNRVRQSGNRFIAVTYCKGERYYVGCFKSKEEAEAALIAKKREIHGEFCSK